MEFPDAWEVQTKKSFLGEMGEGDHIICTVYNLADMNTLLEWKNEEKVLLLYSYSPTHAPTHPAMHACTPSLSYSYTVCTDTVMVKRMDYLHGLKDCFLVLVASEIITVRI